MTKGKIGTDWLIGIDGNAFIILGRFRKQAKRAGWTEQEISAVTEVARGGDYDHLLQTIMRACEG